MPSQSVEPNRIARLVAVIAGLAGVLLCALSPLLPVAQTTATILWPQAPGPDGLVGDITAPLVSGAPEALDASIPCSAVATLPPSGGVLFSTNPADGIDASRNGLFVRANADTVLVAFRDTVAAVAPREAVESGACSTVRVWANPGAVGADFVGIPGAVGTLNPDKKPQFTGVFTDLKVPPQPGLSARIDVDTRFITHPTTLKMAVMVARMSSVPSITAGRARSGRRPSPSASPSSSTSAGIVTTQPSVPGVKLNPCTVPAGTLATSPFDRCRVSPSKLARPPPRAIIRTWCSRAWRWGTNSQSCCTERAAIVSQWTTSGRSSDSPKRL